MTPEEVIAYEAEINNWHAKRIDDVIAPNGWVNLIGRRQNFLMFSILRVKNLCMRF
jgi:hypothetical protein